MKWVHIYKREFGSGQAKIAVTCVLRDGAIEMQGDEQIIARLKTGILVPSAGRELTPNDGERFLTALKNEYRSLKLVATDVQEGEQVTYPQSVDE